MVVLMTIVIKLGNASTREEIRQAYSVGAQMLQGEFGPSDDLAQLLRQLQAIPPGMSDQELIGMRTKIAHKLADQADFLKRALGE
jgi:hypothetical protein